MSGASLSGVETRLAGIGVGVPEVAAPVADYVPAVAHDGIVTVSGQLPFVEGKLELTGKAGAERTDEEAASLAGIAALNAVAAVKSVIGDLDRVTQVIRVGVFVNSAPDFTRQAFVANGASELIGVAFGDAGKHARAAVGVAVLPLDSVVEVELAVAYA